MSLAHLYQDFSPTRSDGVGLEGMDELALEDFKLEAFEKGYQAGWDDAVEAQVASHTRISSDFEKNLIETCMTAEEIRKDLVAELEPLFGDIMNVLLPETARAALGAHVAAELAKLADQKLDHILEVTTSSQNLSTLESLIDQQVERPFAMIADDALSEGQVFLRIGNIERLIDLSCIVDEVREAMKSFFPKNEEVEKID